MSDDRRDVEEILHRYYWAKDTGDLDALRRTVTDDVVYTRITSPGAAEEVVVDGVEDLVRQQVALGEMAVAQHQQTNVVVDLGGETATAVAQLVARAQVAADRPLITAGSATEYHLRRTSDGWRIARQQVRWLWQTGGDWLAEKPTPS